MSMKRQIKTFAAATLCGAAMIGFAFGEAVETVAYWDKDFGTAAKGGYAVSFGTGATLNADGTVSLAQQTTDTATTGVSIDFADEQGATAFSGSDLTVIVRYSGLVYDDKRVALFSTVCGTSATDAETVVSRTKGGKICYATGIDASATATDNALGSVATALPAKGLMIVTMAGGGRANGIRVGFASRNSDGTYGDITDYGYASTNLFSGKSFYGIRVGGTVGSIQHFHRPGMKVEAVALVKGFTTTLKTFRYLFPDECYRFDYANQNPTSETKFTGNATLAEIANGVFSAKLMSNKTAWYNGMVSACQKSYVYSGDELVKMPIQYQVLESGIVKSSEIYFTNRTDGVYFKRTDGHYDYDTTKLGTDATKWSKSNTYNFNNFSIYVPYAATIGGTGYKTLAEAEDAAQSGDVIRLTSACDENLTTSKSIMLDLNGYANTGALAIEVGGLVTLVNAAGVANPFSTGSNANRIAGVLDLGGAKQTFSGGVDQFQNGCGLRNGAYALSFPGSTPWAIAGDKTVSILANAAVTTVRVGSGTVNNTSGQMQITGTLLIDGGSLTNNCYYGDTKGQYQHFVADGGLMRIANGGSFVSTYKSLCLGKSGTGTLVVDGGSVILKNGAKDLTFCYGDGTAGVAAMTNGLLVANEVVLGWSGNAPTAQLSVRDSVLNIKDIRKEKALNADSFVKFDNATIVATGDDDTTLLGNLGFAYEIKQGGLTVSNANDAIIDGAMTGAGGLVKMGAGKLTLRGTQTFAGDIEIAEGTLEIAGSVASTTVKVADGATVGATLTADGFNTQNMTLALDPETEGSVTIDISGSPEPGTSYTLFASGITEETLARVNVDASFELKLEEGQLKVKVVPQTLTWTGNGADKNWSTTENWNGTRGPAAYDSVIFNGDGDVTALDRPDELQLTQLTVQSGAWTADVQTATLAGTPIAVSNGTAFALANATEVANPFATGNNANVIAGVLDLGGATQDFSGDSTQFADGGELRNGAFSVSGTGIAQPASDVAFTIGTNAAVTTGVRMDPNHQHGTLFIDGGSYVNTYLAGTAWNTLNLDLMRITHGGSFVSSQTGVIVAYKNYQNATVSIDGGSFAVAAGKNLALAYYAGTTANFAITNGQVTAERIVVAGSAKATVKMSVKDSVLNVGGIGESGSLNAASFVKFDGATIVDTGADGNTLLGALQVPYTIEEGGLTVRVGKRTAADATVTLAGTYAGTGTVTLTTKAANPKAINASAVTFPGDVTVADGVALVKDIPEGKLAVDVLSAKGVITVPASWLEKDKDGNCFFIMNKGGVNVLRYGRLAGMMITIR